jgi:uncharacterized protein YjeT (DUF2065 family)
VVDLWAALCLVAVLEGLLLFATPKAWKRVMAQLLGQSEAQLRLLGGVLMLLGLVAMWLLRGR